MMFILSFKNGTHCVGYDFLNKLNDLGSDEPILL